jgi:hypothetical protein
MGLQKQTSSTDRGHIFMFQAILYENWQQTTACYALDQNFLSSRLCQKIMKLKLYTTKILL